MAFNCHLSSYLHLDFCFCFSSLQTNSQKLSSFSAFTFSPSCLLFGPCIVSVLAVLHVAKSQNQSGVVLVWPISNFWHNWSHPSPCSLSLLPRQHNLLIFFYMLFFRSLFWYIFKSVPLILGFSKAQSEKIFHFLLTFGDLIQFYGFQD